MVSKTVCVKCWREYTAEIDGRIPLRVLDGWREGVANCPEAHAELWEMKTGGKSSEYFHDGKNYKIKAGEALPWCPYKFEHGVAEGMKDA